PPIVLDEIQLAPALLHHIKERIDAQRHPGQWLLTGSQSLSLMHGVSQTLAGRVAVLELDPLSAGEAAGHASQESIAAMLRRVFEAGGSRGRATPRKVPDLADWMLRGGFPELRLRRGVDRTLWLSSYVQTYLERDVRDLLRVGDLQAFGRFLGLVAARSGTILNMADLGRDAGVTGPTAKAWLSVLEASHLVFLLRPHFRNLGKRIVKSPKLYLTDPGIVTFLTGLHSSEAALRGPSAGALMETVVVSEWVKLFRQRGERPPLTFYRSNTGDEVDLVIEHDGRTYGIEVKLTSAPTPAHAASLAKWLAATGPGARGVLACAIDAPVALGPRIRAVPWSPDAMG
ncbi:MAG: putative GTP-binding protein, partial [Caulobacteraceae bacterium]